MNIIVILSSLLSVNYSSKEKSGTLEGQSKPFYTWRYNTCKHRDAPVTLGTEILERCILTDKSKYLRNFPGERPLDISRLCQLSGTQFSSQFLSHWYLILISSTLAMNSIVKLCTVYLSLLHEIELLMENWDPGPILTVHTLLGGPLIFGLILEHSIRWDIKVLIAVGNNDRYMTKSVVGYITQYVHSVSGKSNQFWLQTWECSHQRSLVYCYLPCLCTRARLNDIINDSI